MDLTKLVIIRHGESKWNNANIFTGWTDIDLSDKGRKEAINAGKLLKLQGFIFDIAYTSVLKRAIHTLWTILDELDQAWLPVEKSWRLNERHYGALQGFKKIEIEKKYGYKQVQQWRRGLASIPPALTQEDERFPGHDLRYAYLQDDKIPTTESLISTIKRVIPYLQDIIYPMMKNGKRVIIVAHGNTIRAIVHFLSNLSEKEIFSLNIPTGVPLVYEFDKNMKALKYFYL